MSFLGSYERERQPIEHKILVAIERAQKGVSSRNPVVFFMRGRGQRVIPTLINFALDHTDGKVLQFGTQQAWTYATSPLSFEHWERPGPRCPFPIPGILARKDQNLYRWLHSRVHAGDTVPDATVNNTTVHTVLKQSRGWTLLLFEGSAADNKVLSTHVSNVQIYNVDELQSLGDSLKTPADARGYVAGIDEVLVVPAEDEAHKIFNVKAQCLFLIRPDHHVALRSEPLRKDAVLKYFHKQCGMKVPDYSVPTSSNRFDPLPVTVYGTIFAITLGFAIANNFQSTWRKVLLGFVACILAFLSYASAPPRD